jgi:alanyl-tRNA synthetase
VQSQTDAELTQTDADNYRIFYYSDSENWWSRAGAPDKMPVGEPGGPDSEIFWDFGADLKLHEKSEWANQPCHPACDCGRFMEIGNSVFMQYKKTENGFEELVQKNIDFGGGLERITAAVMDTPDVFLIDLFDLPRKKMEELSGKQYGGDNEATKAMRIILDHLRAATFLINDRAEPSNKDQGYFTRRLIRRAVRFGHQLGIEENFTAEIAKSVIETYQDYYTNLADNRERILQSLEDEESKFRKTLQKGLKIIMNYKLSMINSITGKEIFDLYQTYGFPIEMSFEELEKIGMKINKDKLEKEFAEELQKHKDLSRTASAGKFKGGLAGDDKITTQLHTVTHLMLAGLRKVLGESVSQKGSNITPERIRFDFSFDRAMTDEEKQAVEKFVNNAIQTGGEVELTEMPKQQAMDEGVTGAFWEKYPDQVKVYTITAPDGAIYSRELCGGPHIENLSELKNKTFKIVKEKSSGAGVRRIKATIE